MPLSAKALCEAEIITPEVGAHRAGHHRHAPASAAGRTGARPCRRWRSRRPGPARSCSRDRRVSLPITTRWRRSSLRHEQLAGRQADAQGDFGASSGGCWPGRGCRRCRNRRACSLRAAPPKRSETQFYTATRQRMLKARSATIPTITYDRDPTEGAIAPCAASSASSEPSPVAERLIESLKRLEYRGYDSAGVAALVDGKARAPSRQGQDQGAGGGAGRQPLNGHGRHRPHPLGHPRRARPSANAHPHTAGRVDRGPQRHHRELRRAEGRADRRRPRLRERHRHRGRRPPARSRTGHGPDAARGLQGDAGPAVAAPMPWACWSRARTSLILGARRGSPLVVGYGDGEMFIGSDALARRARSPTAIAYLEEGDYVAIDHDGARIFDAHGKPVDARRSRPSPPPPPWWRRATTGTSWKRRSMTSRTACQRTIAGLCRHR